MADIAELGFRVDTKGIVRADKDLNRLDKTGRKVEKTSRTLSRAIGAIGISAIAADTVNTFREFERLNASLITVTGSASNAAVAFDQIKEFAQTTPFSLTQATEGFVKLKALGLDPSIDTMMSLSNISSAMGKDLIQAVEAVADAVTGEFERLKEFGIKASQEGDNVAFTFQGVTTVVEKNADAIQGYLTAIGQNQFAGATARQMETLNGAVSNLGDAFDALQVELVESTGAGEAFKDTVNGLAAAVRAVTPYIDEIAIGIGALVVANVAGRALTFLATAAGSAATALSLLRVPLALMGGPAGIATLAALGLYNMGKQSTQADQAADDLKQAISDLNVVMSDGVEKSDDLGKSVFDLTKQQYDAAKAALAQARALLAVQKASTKTGTSFRDIGVADAQIRKTTSEIERLETQVDASAAAIKRYVSAVSDAPFEITITGDAAQKTTTEIEGLSDALDEGVVSIGNFTDDLQALIDRLFPTEKKLRDLSYNVRTLELGLASGEMGLKKYFEALEKLKEEFNDTEDATKSLADVTEDAKIVITRSFGDIIFEAKSLKDALTGIFDAIARSIVDKLASIAVEGIFDKIASIFKGGGGGGLGDLFNFAGIAASATKLKDAAVTAGAALGSFFGITSSGLPNLLALDGGLAGAGLSLGALAGPLAAAAAGVGLLSGAFSGARSASEIMRDEVRQLREQIVGGTAEVFSLAEGFKAAGASGALMITGDNLSQLQKFLEGIDGINTRLQEVDGEPVLRVLDSMGRSVGEIDKIIKGKTASMTQSFADFSENAQSGADQVAGTFIDASNAMLSAGENASGRIGESFNNAAGVTEDAAGRMESSLSSAADAATGKIRDFSSSSVSSINKAEGSANSFKSAIDAIPSRKYVDIITRYFEQAGAGGSGGGGQANGESSQAREAATTGNAAELRQMTREARAANQVIIELLQEISVLQSKQLYSSPS